jgi:hypothetical protein
MTDEAITVAADAAPMPIDNGSQGGGPEVADQPSPAATETRTSPTSRDAIARAFEKMNAGEQGEKTVEGGEAQSGRERNPDGTFKAIEKAAEAAPAAKVEVKPATEPPKPATALGEAPTRFSADAKAAWATAPDAVKAETTRAIRELEGGIEQYRQSYEPYRDFDKQLKANGQTFQEVFAHYTGIEKLLETDLLKGLDQISRNSGYSLRQIAEHVMGQPADENSKQADNYVNELKAEIADLKKQVGGVTTTIRSQQEKALLDQVEAFWTDPAHPRAEELAEDIVFFFKSGKTSDLKEAYQLAERLNPAPVMAPPPAAPAATQTAAPQTRKGQLSLSGAPAPGSDPVTRKPPSSAREAIERSFASLGL